MHATDYAFLPGQGMIDLQNVFAIQQLFKFLVAV